MRAIHDYLYDVMIGPERLRWTAWGITLLFSALAVGAAWIFPRESLAIYGAAIMCILAVWEGRYEEWSQNAHRSQDREAIGMRAVLVHLRIATFGALALVLLGFALIYATGRGIDPTWHLIANIAIALSIPLSFFVPAIRRFHLDATKATVNLPFQVAMLGFGTFSPLWMLDHHHARINVAARKAFGLVTGYPSNLTFLMNTDDILRKLPTKA